MLDEGSTITLIDKNLAREIGARGARTKISIKGISPRATVHCNCERVNVKIQGSFGEFVI